MTRHKGGRNVTCQAEDVVTPQFACSCGKFLTYRGIPNHRNKCSEKIRKIRFPERDETFSTAGPSPLRTFSSQPLQIMPPQLPHYPRLQKPHHPHPFSTNHHHQFHPLPPSYHYQHREPSDPDSGPTSLQAVGNLLHLIAAPHSQIAAPHSRIAAPHSQIAAPHSQIAAPHSQIELHRVISIFRRHIQQPHRKSFQLTSVDLVVAR